MTLLQPGFEFEPVKTLTDQSLAADGSYVLNMPNMTVPTSGIVYVNVTGNDCQATPNYPSGELLVCVLPEHDTTIITTTIIIIIIIIIITFPCMRSLPSRSMHMMAWLMLVQNSGVSEFGHRKQVQGADCR